MARILLAETNVLVAMDIKDLLEDMGHHVCGTAVSGKDALQQIENDPPDLVFLNLSLDGCLSGVDTARRIMQNHNASIVFLTGYSQGEKYEQALALSPDEILFKPAAEEDLQRLLREYDGE